MKIDFTICGADDIKTDLENLRNFKNRWIKLISGFDPEIQEEDLELTQSLLTAEMCLENLLSGLKDAETAQHSPAYIHPNCPACKIKDNTIHTMGKTIALLEEKLELPNLKISK